MTRSPGRAERIDQAFEIPVIVAALLVLPVIAVENSDTSEALTLTGQILNWGIWLVFVAEAVVKVMVAPDRRAWVRTHPLEITIVILTPPFLPPALSGMQVLRLLRVMRLARLFLVLRDFEPLDGVRWSIVGAAIVIVAGGTAFTAVEDDVSNWDGIWWALTTMATVGYGDISPTTDAGRVVAIIVMALGIGLFTTIVASLSGGFAGRLLGPDLPEPDPHAADPVLLELRRLHARIDDLEARLPSPETTAETPPDR